MKAKVLGGFLIVSMLVGAMISAAPAAASPPPPDYKPVDVGPEIREWEPTVDKLKIPEGGFTAEFLDELEATALQSADDDLEPCIQDVKVWFSLDDYYGWYFAAPFYLIATNDNAELWLQFETAEDPVWGGDAGRAWPAGDPRDTPVVTCEQAAYLLSEYSSNINPVESDFFGPADFHDGSAAYLVEDLGWFPTGYFENADGRQVVLVSNVRDDNYYDPTYPNYIAGFYSPSFEVYFDRNIMSIDAYDWANRVGPDGGRPYLYESVFAHEYQHLLHDDYDSDEVSWVNEGLSMFSEFLTGYVTNEDNYSTFQELPENSLVAWGDQGGREIVADYGMVFLYQMFLYEKFGPAFLQAEFFNTDNGISSINSTMAMNNKWRTSSFADTYHDFSVAVLLDSDKNKYRYGFEFGEVGIDIGTPDAPNPDAFDTPGAPPWGADYIWIDGDPKELGKFSFNGVDFSVSGTPWTSNGEILYGGDGDLIDNWAIFPATGGGTLSFDTYWDIEDYWDFGFVQVSTDGGNTWTSLENAYTTYLHDPNAHPDIVANLPGLTGWSGGWLNITYDLGAYSGDILIAFRYMTDWGTTYEGWYIDNVYVDDTLISDGSDASIFQDISELFPVENDFTVTFVGFKKNGYKVFTVKLSDMDEAGMMELNKLLKQSDSAVMIVTFDAPEGFLEYADYTYDFTYTNAGPKK